MTRIEDRLEEIVAAGLSLDMSRGQPSAEQLSLSDALWAEIPVEELYTSNDGQDCRNYPGGAFGLPEIREVLAPCISLAAEQIMVRDNSSLSLMYDAIVFAFHTALPDASKPWLKEDTISFLCPSPGYDRHFKVCEAFGIKMIPVRMNADGPEMDQVEDLVSKDSSIKGIWCVPQYSNPTGVTYSDEVVDRFARMNTAAKDFRIFWDNAYALHHLVDAPKPVKNILEACERAGNENRPFVFASTSKVTFAGGGLSYIGASPDNLAFLAKNYSTKSITPNKINQHRHAEFLSKYPGGVKALMAKHAEDLKPKFDAIDRILTEHLAGTELAQWSKPEGGYFISLDTQAGMAKAVIAKAGELGVKLTPAGATWPHGEDPQDQNIRIAPSRPSLADIESAAEVLALSILWVAKNK